jgi:hypothetical protein
MMGTRETVVAVVGQSVMVMQTGLRRAKRREWPRSEVKTARVGASGTEINDQPILELQLLGADDKKLFGMLAGRDARELTWMATLSRQALKSTDPTHPEPLGTDEAQVAPDGSGPLAARQRETTFNFEGMTVPERMQVARLSDQFTAALERGDRKTMVELLQRVQLPPSGAEAFAEAVCTDPRRHGF